MTDARRRPRRSDPVGEVVIRARRVLLRIVRWIAGPEPGSRSAGPARPGEDAAMETARDILTRTPYFF